jgi:hypothetical protein
VARSELVSEIFGCTGGAEAGEVESLLADGLLAYVGMEEEEEQEESGAEAVSCRVGAAAGGVWVGAGSPRLRVAFGALVTDPAYIAYREKAMGELRKHEQSQRMEQLALRRTELARELKAKAKLLDVLGGVQGEHAVEGAAARVALAELTAEQQTTAEELRHVRSEYDREKWKGRWAQPQAPPGPAPGPA